MGDVGSVPDLARLLRQLRRRDARRRGDSQLTYRELAMRTGWSVAAIGEYFAGRTLPPTDRFDALVQLLGASPDEQRMLATARDRLEEGRRRPSTVDMPVPRQLPAEVPGFTGRAEQLATLDHLLSGLMGGPVATVVITAVSGAAGVGKTALAVHWARRAAPAFPDGQLYVNLRGFDPAGPPMRPADAVRGLLDALGVRPERVPADLDARTGLYRSLLADRRMLIVLDNARDAEQVRPLLPGAPGCLVLVTSRNRLSGLVAAEGARPVTVDLLTPAEARDLLAARLGPARLAAEPDAAEQIIASCARLPLALAVVAARAALHPDFPLASVAADLRDTLDDVRAVFSWSYRQLGDDAARLFRLLGLPPGPDLSAPAATSLAGTAARPALAELTDANLIVEHTPGRYALHDLLRAYAAELAHTHDTAADRDAATRRLLDHYLHTAYTADRLLYPHRDPIDLDPPRPGARPEELGGYEEAMAWYAAEHAVILAAVDHTVTAGLDAYTWRLAWTTTSFLHLRGLWPDMVTVQQAALEAGRRLCDRHTQAVARHYLGLAAANLARYDEAGIHNQHAVDLCRDLGDDNRQAHAHINCCWVLEKQGRTADALDHARQALDLYRAVGNRAGEGDALNSAGWCLAVLGDLQPALTCCQEALAVHERTGDRYLLASTWDSLGHIHHRLGHREDAFSCYRHALEGFRSLGDRSDEAGTLTRLGDAHQAAGNHAAARDAWEEALDILDDLGHPDADTVRAKLAAIAEP